jgi:hypothetical protein
LARIAVRAAGFTAGTLIADRVFDLQALPALMTGVFITGLLDIFLLPPLGLETKMTPTGRLAGLAAIIIVCGVTAYLLNLL